MKRKIETNIILLHQKSEEIQNNNKEDKEYIQTIIKDLEDTLENKGIGLSAIQIDIRAKVAIIRLPNCELNLVNPKIIKKEDRFRFIGERCLSLPGLSIDTSRYRQILIENGDGKRYVLEGLEAIACQHECDHLDGRLIIDAKWRKRR